MPISALPTPPTLSSSSALLCQQSTGGKWPILFQARSSQAQPKHRNNLAPPVIALDQTRHTRHISIAIIIGMIGSGSTQSQPAPPPSHPQKPLWAQPVCRKDGSCSTMMAACLSISSLAFPMCDYYASWTCFHLNSRKTSHTQREPPQPDPDTHSPPKKASTSSSCDHSLPDGWAMEYTDTGRAYFVDLKTLKTTWVDPRLDGQLNKDLPKGWEAALDKDGHVYYIDHTNKRTQRQRPSATSDIDSVCVSIDDDSADFASGGARSREGRGSVSSLSSWSSLSSLISTVSSVSISSARALVFGEPAAQDSEPQGMMPRLNRFFWNRLRMGIPDAIDAPSKTPV